jgi:hypothetical protein
MTFTDRCRISAATATPRRARLARWTVSAISLFLVPAFLNAATYYASPTGSDTNPGTNSQPFRTVARGIQAASAGDTIVLKDGTYPADTPLGGGSRSTWLLWINKSGAPGAPITLKAENKQKAILDCGNAYNGSKTGCMGYIYLGNPGPAYWVFQDLVFTRTYDIAFLMNASTPAHDITVKGCRFEQIGQHVTAQTTGMNGLYANQGHYNLVFDGNVFNNIGRLPGSTYMFNDHGLYLHSSNTTVINNVFYGSISGWGVQTASGFSGLIANNTFAFTAQNTGGQVMLWDPASGGITVRNNVFYNPPGGVGVATCGLTASSCVLDHNLVYGGSIGGRPGCGSSTTVCTSSNTSSGNPGFVNASGGDFHLTTGSPAIDAGVSVSGVATDADGVSRPQGGSLDLGAFEFASAAQPPVISAVAATNLTSNSATITWTTNKAADSQVKYGIGSYTASTALNTSQVTQHSASVASLSPSTVYHYQVLSCDSAGNRSTSADFTFTTAATAPPPPPPAGFSYSLSSSASNITGTPGQNAAATITATLASGTGQAVYFTASGLPSGVTASFSPAQCTATCSTSMTLAIASSAATGTSGITVNGSGAASASTQITLAIGAPPASGAAAASWSFSEGRGSQTADASGNGNTGTLVGTSWAAFGSGNALWFSGSGSYVSVNESSSLAFSKTMTVSFWILAFDVSGVDQRIVSKNYDWDVKLNGSSHVPQLTAGSASAALNYSLPIGTWQHVVFTLSNGTAAGYINGAPVSLASNTFSSGFTLPQYQYGLNIGADAGKANNAKGVIDEVRLYNRALSAAEVSTLYSQTRH